MSVSIFCPADADVLTFPQRGGMEHTDSTFSLADYRETLRQRPDYHARSRARLERSNRDCPCCRRATVETVERGDGSFNRQGSVIPFSATVAGFSCRGCGHHWRTTYQEDAVTVGSETELPQLRANSLSVRVS